MATNIFFTLKPPRYPMKMFTEVNKATAWLKKLFIKNMAA
jgi:hypothetical protein